MTTTMEKGTNLYKQLAQQVGKLSSDGSEYFGILDSVHNELLHELVVDGNYKPEDLAHDILRKGKMYQEEKLKKKRQ